MGRNSVHNWQKLFLEYNQGRYKSARQFAEAKGLNYDRLKKEFKKIKDAPPDENGGKIGAENRGKKGQKKSPKKEKGQNEHPWEQLKKQFTDWPEEKLQAYLMQLEARKSELEAMPFEELAPGEVKELGRIRRERRAILSDPDPERRCHAHNRDGSPCENPAERGKEVCWNHGGAPGSGAQPGAQNALKHGFFAKIFPDDEETREIIESITEKSPLDIIWDNIVIQYTAIARAQKTMFVTHKQEMIKELKKFKSEREVAPSPAPNLDEPENLREIYREEEWEFQFAWDRQATFLTAQSKAMKTLEGLIARYEEMIQKGNASEEHRLRLEKFKQDMAIARERMDLEKSKVMGDPDPTEDDGFIEALQGKAGEAWDGHTEED